MAGLVPLLLLLCASLSNAATGQQQQQPSGSKVLKRSNAKRWQNLKEIVEDHLRVNTKQFLLERGQVGTNIVASAVTSSDLSDLSQSVQVFKAPLVVDVVLLGFDGSGSYHYQLQYEELQEMLAAGPVSCVA
jgi:phosphoribosylaminoimidazole carboxylase (NCAIR synthetase)